MSVEVTDEQLAEIEQQVRLDRLAGYPTMLAEWLVRALRDARARIAERAALDEQLCTRSLLDQVVAERDALRHFAEWLVSMDAPDFWERSDRRTVTLGDIIERARVALADGQEPQ